MKNEKANIPEREATLGMSLIMLLVCVVVLSVCIIGLGQDVQVPLSLCTGIMLAYASFYLHIKWGDSAKAMMESISTALEVMMIILLIGATIGTWIASGPSSLCMACMYFPPNFSWFPS